MKCYAKNYWSVVGFVFSCSLFIFACRCDTVDSGALDKEITKKIAKFTRSGYGFTRRRYDHISPVYFEILEYGTNAVPCLLVALESKARLYREKQLDFVCMLAQIGDCRAYPALCDLYKKQITDVRRFRYGVSLGACLPKELIEDYVELLMKNPGSGLRVLRHSADLDFGENKSQWIKYLKDNKNFEKWKKTCQERSRPMVG